MQVSRPRGRPRTFDRSTVLDAAVEQFWKHGFEGASIAELTAASGCTAPTLYALFGSKEALFEAALQRYAEKGFGTRADLLATGVADKAMLAEAVRATVLSLTSPDHPRGCLILTGGLAVGEAGTAAAQAVAGLRAYALEEIVRFLKRAQDQGNLGPVDLDSLARFYLAILQGISAQAIDGATADQLLPLVDVALAAWPDA